MQNIVKTYSGKIGCMCGCRGKWNYTKLGAEKHNPGYPVEANERGAKIIAKRVLNHPKVMLDVESNCAYVEEGENFRAVYFA